MVGEVGSANSVKWLVAQMVVLTVQLEPVREVLEPGSTAVATAV